MAQGQKRALAVVLSPDFSCEVSTGFVDEVLGSSFHEVLCSKSLTKRLRKKQECDQLQEKKHMQRCDYEGALMRQKPEAVGDMRLFRTGQTVHHWRASWFKGATEPRAQLSEKGRPK